LNSWQHAVLYLYLVLTMALLWKLHATGLATTYKRLFVYLAFDGLFTLVGFAFTQNQKGYGLFYFGGQTIKIVIAAFVLIEIYSRALENTPALAQYGRNMVAYILGASALLPLVLLLIDRTTPTRFRELVAFLRLEQTMGAAMGTFLIILTLFLLYFPVRLRRNVLFYAGGFTAWALVHAVTVFVGIHANGNLRTGDIVNLIQSCVQVGCLLYWMAGLRKEGETLTAVVGHLWNREEAERLAEQLDSINDTLERLRRR
jgi:hypothetical protein